MVRSLYFILLLLPLTHFGQYIFPLEDSFNRFAAEVVMADCSNGVCNGAGYVKISEKNGNLFLQTIHFKNQVLFYGADVRVKEGRPAMAFKKAPAWFVDLNFDGFSDLVLGSAESLQLYQYRPEKKQFVLQPLNGRLKKNTVTGIGVDTATKRLVLHYNSSDRKVREEYRWEEGRPQHVFSLSVRERTIGFSTGDQRINPPLPTQREKGVNEAGSERTLSVKGKNKKPTVLLIVVKEERVGKRWIKTAKRFTPETYTFPEAAGWQL